MRTGTFAGGVHVDRRHRAGEGGEGRGGRRRRHRHLTGPLAGALALAGVLPGAAGAASFDCARAATADEKAVCASRLLNDRDVELALRFTQMMGLVPMGGQDLLQRDQTAWLDQRRACADDGDCLLRLYDERILRLRELFEQRVAAQGPF